MKHRPTRASTRPSDAVDDKTQGKYSGHVDTAQDKLKDQFGTRPEDR